MTAVRWRLGHYLDGVGLFVQEREGQHRGFVMPVSDRRAARDWLRVLTEQIADLDFEPPPGRRYSPVEAD